MRRGWLWLRLWAARSHLAVSCSPGGCPGFALLVVVDPLVVVVHSRRQVLRSRVWCEYTAAEM